MDSDYVNEVELPKILAKEKNNECQVVPVILRDCLWTWTELGELQAVLDNERPIEETKGYGKAAKSIAGVITEHIALIQLEKQAVEEQKQKELESVEQQEHLRRFRAKLAA